VGIPTAAVIAVVVTLAAVGSPVGPLAVPPAEAMQQAVNASAAAADESGTVEIEITQDGELWVWKTVTWNGTDLSVSSDDPSQVGRGDLLVVDGVMYGPDPHVAGGWIELGRPESVDPDSGTTPDEFLLAVREDAGGATLQRITADMTDLTTSQTEDGSTIYLGKVPAGAVARESGLKEGESVRVLPYGNVAHDAASNPYSLIDISIIVGADGTISELQATWGGVSSWSYRLTFSDLGSTAPLEKPANVKPCTRCFLPPD
jgi:predicted small lipoprotein YifL